MKIAIDVHGTLSNWPLFWNKALAMLQAMGIKIYVLSGPEKEKIIGRLIALNIDTKWFEGILSVADWIKEQKGATFNKILGFKRITDEKDVR
jgi:hypothetical protein